jgi:hypothetical protein
MSEKYMILIVEPEWDEENATQGDWAEAMKGHAAFAEAVKTAGATIVNGDALGSGRHGVKIQPAQDGVPAQFTDGPFSETKEIVSGYYVIETKDLAQAKELAAQCPSGGWIELYPIIDLSSY